VPGQPFYIAMAIVVLAVIALLVFFVGRKREGRKLTPLASLAFIFVIGGFLLIENRLIGLSLIGVGIVPAIIDMIRKSKSK